MKFRFISFLLISHTDIRADVFVKNCQGDTCCRQSTPAGPAVLKPQEIAFGGRIAPFAGALPSAW
jgi:hypothetical protein